MFLEMDIDVSIAVRQVQDLFRYRIFKVCQVEDRFNFF